MPGDVGGMHAAVVPVLRLLERLQTLAEDTAIEVESLGPVEPAWLWHEPPQVWPCGDLIDHIAACTVEQLARGALVVLPVPRQLPQALVSIQLLEALSQGLQAAGEHDYPALLLNGLTEQWVCRGSCHPLRCCTKTKIRRADRPRYLRPSNKFHSYS